MSLDDAIRWPAFRLDIECRISHSKINSPRWDHIITGTNPLATDMVAANCMGFEPHEIPTFTWAQKAGLKPDQLTDIEVRGVAPDKVARKFARPTIYAWKDIRQSWGTREIELSNRPGSTARPSPSIT